MYLQIHNCYICQLKLSLSLHTNLIEVAATLKMRQNVMNKELKKFIATEFKSMARIQDAKTVVVTAPDGEQFQLMCSVGKYLDEDYRKYELHLIEWIFDKCFSDDKEQMTNSIWRESILNGVSFLGMSCGDRQGERSRIGTRIRQIREERGIEARDLAKLAGVDAANLSRIENGKYSVGLDILSKVATALGKKVDFVDL